LGGATGYSGSVAIWRQARKSIGPYYAAEEASIYAENWREHDADVGVGGAVATPHGTISLRLHNRIRVDMTIDRAVRVINFKVHYKICKTNYNSYINSYTSYIVEWNITTNYIITNSCVLILILCYTLLSLYS